MPRSAADAIVVSFFTSLTVREIREIRLSWPELVSRLRQPVVAARKDALPLIKLAQFRERELTFEMWEQGLRSPRHAANLDRIYGVEGDYDGGLIPVAEAARRLEAAGIRAVIVATPSARVGAPRWRVYAPLAMPCEPAQRGQWVSWLDAVLGGVLARESWTPAQTYYVGRTAETTFEIAECGARCIDECGEIPYVYAVRGVRVPEIGRALAPIADGYLLSPVEADKLRAALGEINADDREIWIRIGLALRPYGEAGRALWGEWSRTSTKWCADDADLRWGAFRPRGEIGLGTIYHLADEARRARLAATVLVEPIRSDEVAPSSGIELAPLHGYLMSGRTITGALNNAVLALQRHGIAGDCRYDTYRGAISYRGAPISDKLLGEIRQIIERATDGRAWSRKDTNEAVEVVAMQQQHNSLADYIQSLRWDGVPRVDEFITRAFGAEQTAYHRQLGWCILGGAVRRALYPGCVVQQSLLLIGGQGLKKSAFAKFLFGEAHVLEDLPADVGSRDAAMALNGKWVVQLSEMDRATRATRTALKSWMTRQTDTFRRPWQVYPEEHRRAFIIIGDCNEPDVLDDAENRRWLPLHLDGHVDLAYIAANREQLFGEVAATLAADPHWLQPYLTEAVFPELALARDEASVEDLWDGAIAEWIAARGAEEPFTTIDVAKFALFLPLDRCTAATSRRISFSLRKLGFELDATAPGTARRWHRGAGGLRRQN